MPAEIAIMRRVTSPVIAGARAASSTLANASTGIGFQRAVKNERATTVSP